MNSFWSQLVISLLINSAICGSIFALSALCISHSLVRLFATLGFAIGAYLGVQGGMPAIEGEHFGSAQPLVTLAAKTALLGFAVALPDISLRIIFRNGNHSATSSLVDAARLIGGVFAMVFLAPRIFNF